MNTRSADLMEHVHKKKQYTRSKRPTATTVGIVGLGYVGLPLALTLEKTGYHIIGYDIDQEKISRIQKRIADFLSPHEMSSFRKSRMRVGAHPHILKNADIYVICVPTPVTSSKEPDLRALIEAAQTVGSAIRQGALVIVESTVNPGVCEDIIIPTIERASRLSADREFHFAYCPERINPGDPHYGVHNIPRVVGASTAESLRVATSFYRSAIGAEIYPMGSIKEAEAVKMVENTFRDINIAFVNELAMAFDRVGIDTVNVIRGASTKPFGFMAHYPSCGVGGHCIPVDPYYLIEYGKRHGFLHHFLLTARHINERMPNYAVALLEDALQTKHRALRGSTIALLGLAYKQGISDTRESPALAIMNNLQRAGARVYSYDPYASHPTSVESVDAALSLADAVIIATDHDEFCRLTPDDLYRNNIEIVIDGKNCLNKDLFTSTEIVYRGIGR